jgi:hypothetical protein
MSTHPSAGAPAAPAVPAPAAPEVVVPLPAPAPPVPVLSDEQPKLNAATQAAVAAIPPSRAKRREYKGDLDKR